MYVSSRLFSFSFLFLKIIIFIPAPFANSSARRQFFGEYAQTKGFDPLDPENWYSQSKEGIMSTTVMTISNSLINNVIYLLYRKRFKSCITTMTVL